MKTILIDVKNERASIIDCKPELDEYYRHLDCDCIDIVMRKIGGKWFDVMCDDEGLFKAEPKMSAINDLGEPMLVGNLMFFHNDGEGNLVGLDDEDIEHLKKHIMRMYTRRYPAGYPMLVQCEYN